MRTEGSSQTDRSVFDCQMSVVELVVCNISLLSMRHASPMHAPRPDLARREGCEEGGWLVAGGGDFLGASRLLLGVGRSRTRFSDGGDGWLSNQHRFMSSVPCSSFINLPIYDVVSIRSICHQLCFPRRKRNQLGNPEASGYAALSNSQ